MATDVKTWPQLVAMQEQSHTHATHTHTHTHTRVHIRAHRLAPTIKAKSNCMATGSLSLHWLCGLFAGVKAAETCVYQSPSSSSEVKNEYSYTFFPTLYLI